MAALDFPNTPTLNQTFTAPNGVIWAWDGAKWVNGTMVGTGYAPVNNPVFTGDPQAPTAASGDSDQSLATTAFVQAAVAPALHDVGRNLLHNPLMQIAQRGVGPFTTTGYTLDRWQFTVATDTTGINQVALSDSDRVAIGDEAAGYSLQAGVAGNAAAGAFSVVMQRIENVRRLSGKTVTVSFWANAAAAIKLGISVDQYFGTGGSPSATVQGVGQAVSIPGLAWARYSLTFALPSMSGKTIGTNGDNSTQLLIWLSSGATNATRAGNIGVQSGTVNLWGVQVEAGSVATPLEKPDPRYDLANCQRFFYLGSFWLGAYGATGATVGSEISLPVTMRAVPTVAATSNNYTNAQGGSVVAVGAGLVAALAAVTAAGTGYYSGNFTASADL